MANFDQLSDWTLEQLQVRQILIQSGINPTQIQPTAADHGVDSATPVEPRMRGWIIPHPRFPLGFRHFLDPHQQRERIAVLSLPWFPVHPVHLEFDQKALHSWENGGAGSDETGGVLWRASQVLSDFILLKHAAGRKTVLELGCGGCALPSLAAALCGHRVVATDLESQLPLARQNIDRNKRIVSGLYLPLPPPWSDVGDEVLLSLDISVAALPWGEKFPGDHWWEVPEGIAAVKTVTST